MINMKYLTIEDATKRIDELEAKIKIGYINAIKRFGDKYSDEELERENLESLETIMDACSRFAIEDNIPITPFRDEKRPDKTVIKRIDFSRVFDDVAAKFNMSNIKSESK